jgi:hypothetical protein
MLKQYFTYFFLFTVTINLLAQETRDTTNRAGSSSMIVRARTNRDSVIPDTSIFAWKYMMGRTELEIPADTNQIFVVYHDPIKDYMLYNIGLGNLGQPLLYTDYHLRTQSRHIHWAVQNYRPYLSTHKDVVIFNTKMPYTRLYYTSGRRKWQTFHFVHTQNFNRNINFGLKYDIFSSEGIMVSQRSRNRYGSFWIDVKNYRYRNFTTLNFNRIRTDSNGGIIDSRYVTDSSGLDVRQLDVKLSKSGNDIRLFDGHLNHEVTIARGDERLAFFETGVAHEMYYSKTQRKYYDPLDTKYENKITGETFDYFENRYNKNKTSDTLSNRQLTNIGGIFIHLGSNKNLRLAAMIKNVRENYRNYFSDTLFEYVNDTLVKSYFTLFRLNAKALNGNLTVASEYAYNPYLGYRKDEYNGFVDIRYRHRFFSDTATVMFLYERYKAKPDYFYQKYFSNHYKWQNHWPAQVGINTNLRWQLKKQQLSVSLQMNSMQNQLWLDTLRHWNLASDFIDVYGVGIEKTQRFGRFFSLRAKILYQQTTDTVIDVPRLATSATLLFQTPLYFRNTGGRAHLQIGIDCWLNSKYYVPDFDPALNQFFMQRALKLGDYPFVDVFASAHIKRMVLFVRLEHITAGTQGITYFDAYNYPTRPFNTKLGVSWTFYD